jgi:hypothetical protein
MIMTWENRGARRETLSSATLCITVSHRLASDRTRTSAVRGRRPTFGPMARSLTTTINPYPANVENIVSS